MSCARTGLRAVPNVVDTSTFAPSNDRTAGNAFIHVSALDDDQKNISGILRAFAGACKSNPAFTLTIIGEGAAKKHLMHVAAELGIASRVHFRGKQPASVIAEELRAARALLIFSRYETFCVAAAEALSCGTPVISSDNGGVTSYFQPYMGLLVPSDDEEALKTAMLQEIAAFDPVKSHGYIAEHFSLEAVAARLRSVYSRVLTNQDILGQRGNDTPAKH
jgi:glycosyltransferase involved in cell wall biosynthesis